MSPIRMRLAYSILLPVFLLLALPSTSDADPCMHHELGELGWTQFWSGDAFFSLPWYNPYWALVAVRRDTGTACDADVLAYRNWDGGTYPNCASDFLANSQLEGTYVDFIVGDFNHNPSATTYFHVFCYGGGAAGYIINFDAHNDQLVIDGPAVHGDVGRTDFAEVWDVYLTGGVEYAFDLDATTSDIRMALFASNGSEYWGSRGDGVWETTGDTLWTAPVTDWYGVVVYADHGVEGSYDIRVGYPCVNLELAQNVPAGYSAPSYFRYTQTNPSWNAIAIIRLSGVGEGGLWQFQTWNDQAASPYCAETILSGSDSPGDVTEFVVGDFNHCPLGTYYPLVLWEGGGEYLISWDGDDGRLVPGDAPLSCPVPSLVAEIWDVELMAGQEYMFYLYPGGPDLRMALFQGATGAPWWTARAGSVWETGTTTFWTPPVTDVYGLSVFVDSPGGGDPFDIQVTYACYLDDLIDGSTNLVNLYEGWFFRFMSTQPRWGVVSGRPSPGTGNANTLLFTDWNGGYSPTCADVLIGGSFAPDESVDFIVADFGDIGTGDYYMEVARIDGDSGDYLAQWNESEGAVGSGWMDSRAVTGDYIADIETLYLEGGEEYTFYFDPQGTELRMALFDPNEISSVGGRGDSEWDVDGPTVWTPPTTGYYGLVVYNEGGGEGAYVIAVGPACEYLDMVDGSVYTNTENEYYRISPDIESWNVIAVRNEGSAGDPGVWLGGEWHGDATYPLCITDYFLWSDQPEPDVDFVVGDYHQNPLTPQHGIIGWDGLPDAHARVTWRQASSVLEVGVDEIERAVDEEYIAEIWDIYLEAGTEYLFEFTPRGTELHMALFGSGARVYWATRAGATWDAIGDVVWTADESGWYGLVVYNEGGGNGSFTLGSHDTPVESSFFATLTAPTSVVLRWVVPATAGAEGVNLYRSLTSEGGYARANDEPLPLSGGDGYEDMDLWPDTEYWYALRAVSHDGSETEVAGSPVTVRTGGTSVAALLGVGPNPLVAETTIHYYVPNPGARVELRLVNSRGRIVRTLVDDSSHAPGARGVTWDGRNDAGESIGSGVYFYELAIGSWRHTGKVAVVR